jgi:hypothetical protein
MGVKEKEACPWSILQTSHEDYGLVLVVHPRKGSSAHFSLMTSDHKEPGAPQRASLVPKSLCKQWRETNSKAAMTAPTAGVAVWNPMG